MEFTSKSIIKGGLGCLLSFWLSCSAVRAQEVFLKIKDPKSGDFGTIISPELDHQLIEHLKYNELTFSDWSSFFRMTTPASSRAVLGTYTFRENRIWFLPRFPPDPNITYTISFDYDRLETLMDQVLENRSGRLLDSVRFQLMDIHQTYIQETFPGLDTIPANALRIYLYFSQSMGLQNPYEHIQLFHVNGELIEDAFVELPEGLWNDDRTRLTLLFHPGRVKQGLGPHFRKGSVLESGNYYELIVNRNWKDANGQPLERTFKKKMYVAEAERTKLTTVDWRIETSCKSGCGVKLILKDYVDKELFEKMVRIEDKSNSNIGFKVS